MASTMWLKSCVVEKGCATLDKPKDSKPQARLSSAHVLRVSCFVLPGVAFQLKSQLHVDCQRLDCAGLTGKYRTQDNGLLGAMIRHCGLEVCPVARNQKMPNVWA